MSTPEPPFEGPCPVYSCTLPAEQHDAVDPEAGFDAEPNSLWHSDELAGICWPAPLESLPPEPRAPESTSLYGPYEERYQREERARRLAWSRPSWLSSMVDVDFEAHMLNSPVVFSGDLRPQAEKEETHG